MRNIKTIAEDFQADLDSKHALPGCTLPAKQVGISVPHAKG